MRAACLRCIANYRIMRSTIVFKLIFLFTCLFLSVILIHYFVEIKREQSFLLKQKKKFITFHWTTRWGVGNEMFALASTVGINHMLNNTRIICLNGKAKFPTCTTEFLTQYMGAAVYHELHYAKYDPAVEYIPPGINVVLDRFFQSWKYFKAVPKEIKKLFTFPEDLTSEAKEFLNREMRETVYTEKNYHPGEPILKIGVHVRRKNLDEDHLKRLGYTQAPKEYFEKAFTYFRELFKKQNIAFVICSDEIDWAEKHLRNIHQNNIFINTGRPMLDLAILASCDHSIISVGTFGWWSAWLSNGITIYYKDWPRNESQLYFSTSHDDYYFKNWIPM